MHTWLTFMCYFAGLTLSRCELRVLMRPASNITRTINEHFTIWEPVRTSGYYIVGQHLEENKPYPKLLMPVVTGIEGDDVATPTQITRIFYSHTFLQVWRMKCPTGFGALGDLSTLWRAPNKYLYRCINKRHLIEAKPGLVMGYLRPQAQTNQLLGFVRIAVTGGWNNSFYYAADHDLSKTNLIYTLKNKYIPGSGAKSLRTVLIVIAVLLPMFALGLFIKIWKRYGNEFTGSHTRLESETNTIDDSIPLPPYIDIDISTNQDGDGKHVTHFYDQIKASLPQSITDGLKPMSTVSAPKSSAQILDNIVQNDNGSSGRDPDVESITTTSSENSYEQPIPQQQPVYFDLNAPYNKDL